MSRIVQLESLIIDRESKQILFSMLTSALPFKDLYKFTHELNLLIDFLFYRFTIVRNKPLPGQFLQNILFADSKTGQPMNTRQKILYLLVCVIGKYIHRKLKMKVLEFCWKAANLVYFLWFLSQEREPKVYSLILMLMGVSVRSTNGNATRELDFELLNRTLIWETLSQVLVFAYNLSGRFLKKVGQLFFLTSFLGNLESSASNSDCYVCQESLKVMPIRVRPCSHSFCYYCYKSQEGGKCPQCLGQVEAAEMVE